jgi:IS66 C-terminal element
MRKPPARSYHVDFSILRKSLRTESPNLISAASARLNDVDPQAWLADVLARINDHAIADLATLLPWRWAAKRAHRKLAA